MGHFKNFPFLVQITHICPFSSPRKNPGLTPVSKPFKAAFPSFTQSTRLNQDNFPIKFQQKLKNSMKIWQNWK